ncbi:MAG: aminotransferase class V-fold PLP-dependent enzyme [Oscillatoriales cyanobacterium SM2_1_8]|nr:aminotransferase class V-fold PLP-dependent enzyme [Oscillatoriales cyanobacterium SM2_1_8]
MNFAIHRPCFPGLADRIYLNYGGQGPLSEATLQAIAAGYRRVEALGSYSHAGNAWVMQELVAIKQTLAGVLGVTPETLTLTENTTVGCNVALWGIDWQPGDRLLLSAWEHPGIVAIAQVLQRRFGIAVDVLPLRPDGSAAEILADLAAQCRATTRAVAISHVAWNTGDVLPLAEMAAFCRARDILTVVDGAQSAGVLPLDLAALGVDAYAFTGHKWLLGPQGTGVLYLRQPLQPTYVGWRGLDGGHLNEAGPQVAWHRDGSVFEVATSAYPLLGAWRTAIAEANAWGTAGDRYGRLCELAEILRQGLARMPGVTPIQQQPLATGLVCFTVAGRDPHELARHLETERQICLRAIPEPLCLRASVHCLTTEAEIETLVQTIAALG